MNVAMGVFTVVQLPVTVACIRSVQIVVPCIESVCTNHVYLHLIK